MFPKWIAEVEHTPKWKQLRIQILSVLPKWSAEVEHKPRWEQLRIKILSVANGAAVLVRLGLCQVLPGCFEAPCQPFNIIESQLGGRLKISKRLTPSAFSAMRRPPWAPQHRFAMCESPTPSALSMGAPTPLRNVRTPDSQCTFLR